MEDGFTMCKQGFETIDILAEKLKDVEGDIVECGVWRGGMLAYMGKKFPDRKLWACDSFEGLPELQIGDPHYKHDQKQYRNHGGKCAASMEEVKETMKTFGVKNEIEYVKGWFDESLPKSGIKRIALLRIDADMYRGTMDVLENLYPLVSPGGAVIIDDSSIETAYDAMKDYLEKHKIGATIRRPDTMEPIWGAGVLDYINMCGVYSQAWMSASPSMWWIKEDYGSL